MNSYNTPLTKFHHGIASGSCPVQAYVSSASLLITEIVAQAGYDSVAIDLQHGESEYHLAFAQLGALRAHGVTPMVRVPWNDPATIMKVLDAGALGVICPLINSRAEAERFVGACRYPPDGYRSVGQLRSAPGLTDGTVGDANAVIQTIAQIETMAAIERIEDIVTTPGLNALFPGPTDLSVSAGGAVGKVDYDDPEAVARLRYIIAAAHSAGVHVGLPAIKPEWIAVLLSIGTDWIQIGIDFMWVQAAAAATLSAARGAISEYGDSHDEARR
jgi:4-hydroxy-2-oxoheptanedioate aldolase